MCNHTFSNSIKEGVFFCTKCSTLSYKNIPAITLPLLSNDKILIDPLLLKYKYLKTRINYNKQFNCMYLSFRHVGIEHIKEVSNYFNLSKSSFYRAINYLDEIYLNYVISPELITKISSICLMLTIQFNECCTKESNSNLKGFSNYLNSINGIREIEFLCLKCLNYNLGIFSSFDYLNLFFSLGIIFPNKKYDNNNQNYNEIIHLYLQCVNILNIIIEDIRCLELDKYILALSIIKMVCLQSQNFNEEIIKYIYGINLSKEKYIKCIGDIKIILSTLTQNKIESKFNSNFDMMKNDCIQSFNLDYFSDNSTSVGD